MVLKTHLILIMQNTTSTSFGVNYDLNKFSWDSSINTDAFI